MQYTGTAVQQVQQQYSRFAVLVQQYSKYSWTRIGQRPVYCSTAVQHSTAVQQYSSSTAVQQTAGAQRGSGHGGLPSLSPRAEAPLSSDVIIHLRDALPIPDPLPTLAKGWCAIAGLFWVFGAFLRLLPAGACSPRVLGFR